MLRKDGSTVPVEIVGKLLKNDAGLPVGFQGSTHDITERVAAREETARLHENEIRINYSTHSASPSARLGVCPRSTKPCSVTSSP